MSHAALLKRAARLNRGLVAGKVPSDAPSEVKQVATLWVASAIIAGENEIESLVGPTSDADLRFTRKFWKDRLHVSVGHRPDPEKGPRWVIGDNHERSSNMIHYPDVGEWYSMPNYGSEKLMRGGFREAMASAKIFWTG